jgi:hypothetical protein
VFFIWLTELFISRTSVLFSSSSCVFVEFPIHILYCLPYLTWLFLF